MASLSTVVSKLMRASTGASDSVKDEDLDRYVAELIMKEAKQSEQRYGQDGVRAFISTTSDTNAPKTNKRFLHSIIRNVDDHNSAILRAQAKAAEEVRLQREEDERAERRARAVEASQERMRRLMGGGRRRSRERPGTVHSSRNSMQPSSSSHKRSRSRERLSWREADNSAFDYPVQSDRRGKHERQLYGEDWGSLRVASPNAPPSRRRSVSPVASGSGRGEALQPSPHISNASQDVNAVAHASGTEPILLEERGRRSPTPLESLSSVHDERPSVMSRKRRRSRSPSGTPPDDDEDRSRHGRTITRRSLSHVSRLHAQSPPKQRQERIRASILRDGHVSQLRTDKSRRTRSPEAPSPRPLSIIRHRHSRSPSPATGEEDHSRRRRHKSHRPKSFKVLRSRSPSPTKHEKRASRKHHHSSPPEKHHESNSEKKKRKSSRENMLQWTSNDEDKDGELGLHPATHSSKMDKYFDPSYDPLLDYQPIADVNSFVQDGAFEGWDAMLQLLRQRREDKEDKKWLERLGVSPSTNATRGAATSAGAGDADIKDIVYKKRGAVREWDLGKD